MNPTTRQSWTIVTPAARAPAAKRRWGYYALPVLYGDRLVGKLDAAAERKAGLLVVNAIHQDVPFTAAMTAAVDEQIAGLAAWLGLGLRRELEPERYVRDKIRIYSERMQPSVSGSVSHYLVTASVSRVATGQCRA